MQVVSVFFSLANFMKSIIFEETSNGFILYIGRYTEVCKCSRNYRHYIYPCLYNYAVNAPENSWYTRYVDVRNRKGKCLHLSLNSFLILQHTSVNSHISKTVWKTGLDIDQSCIGMWEKKYQLTSRGSCFKALVFFRKRMVIGDHDILLEKVPLKPKKEI